MTSKPAISPQQAENTRQAEPLQRVFVWDLPTRLFHWLLVFAITVSVVTGEIGGAWIEWHGRSGLAIVGLLVFRLLWGVLGPPTARFAHFVRGPKSIRQYLQGEWRGIGHNPLGALAVLAMLAAIAFQVGSGLLANDDITFQGPLADLISKALSDRFRSWHSTSFYVLATLVGIHVAAIAFYVRIKRDKLIRPMLTGWKDVAAASSRPLLQQATHRRHVWSALALLFALGVSAGAVYAAAGGFLASPPAPATTPAPAW